ncbi:MAG: glutamine--tRNA ligase, partial [Clostridia bacterium]|nr:glutamine--tRNA ligase [Clostridia bacterium]
PSAETESGDFKENLNPDSLQILSDCKLEGALANAKAGDTFQFLRHGYFCVDPDSTEDKLIFNRTVSLKDSWAKQNG